MALDLSWLKEENWATDIMSDYIRKWVDLEEGKNGTEAVSPQVGYKMEFADWVLPVSVIGVVGVVVLVLWLAIKT